VGEDRTEMSDMGIRRKYRTRFSVADFRFEKTQIGGKGRLRLSGSGGVDNRRFRGNRGEFLAQGYRKANPGFPQTPSFRRTHRNPGYSSFLGL